MKEHQPLLCYAYANDITHGTAILLVFMPICCLYCRPLEGKIRVRVKGDKVDIDTGILRDYELKGGRLGLWAFSQVLKSTKKYVIVCDHLRISLLEQIKTKIL